MKRFNALLIVSLVSLLAISAYSGVIPGHSNGFGKSLGEWQLAYWTAALTDGGPEAEGNVLFMPVPEGEFNEETGYVVGELDVEIAAGTAFFLPIFMFIGEDYQNNDPVPDDPADYTFIFLDNPGIGGPLSALITLDGKSLIDSDTDDLTDTYSGPVFFDPVLRDFYPIDRGGDSMPEICEAGDGSEAYPCAAGATWAQGLGFANTPLPVGEHTLHLLVWPGLGFGFDNTWHITVTE